MGRKPSTSKPTLPDHWPTDPPIIYLNGPVPSKHLTPAQQHFLSLPPPPNSPIESPSHKPPVLITPILSPTHPAYRQHGLFVTRPCPPGSFLLFYLGLIHNSSPADNNPLSSYDLSLDRDADLAIDATHMGNEARFINDYRGVPGREDKGPNCEFRDCWVKTGGGKGWERRVGVYVLPAGRAGKRKEGVKMGEEVLVSYGKGFWCRGVGMEGQSVEAEGGEAST